jgi:hypothetical protein
MFSIPGGEMISMNVAGYGLAFENVWRTPAFDFELGTLFY